MVPRLEHSVDPPVTPAVNLVNPQTPAERRERFAYDLTDVAFAVNPKDLKGKILEKLEKHFGPPGRPYSEGLLQSEHTRYLGVLGLLEECSPFIHDPDIRESIADAFDDACEEGDLRWHLVGQRMVIEPVERKEEG